MDIEMPIKVEKLLILNIFNRMGMKLVYVYQTIWIIKKISMKKLILLHVLLIIHKNLKIKH